MRTTNGGMSNLLRRAGAAMATVLVAVACAVTLGAQPAYAYTQDDLAVDTTVPQVGYTELAAITKAWTAGETRTLKAGLAAASSTTGNMMVAARISCGDDWGVNTTQNSTGQPEITKLVVNWLWTAPADGEYTCRLFGRSKKGAGGATDADYLTALAGGQTYLWLSGSVYPGSAIWSTAEDCVLYPATCQAGDEGVFVGAGLPAGSAEYVLHSNSWTAASSTTSVRLVLDAELTACYYYTDSCPQSTWGPLSLKGQGSAGHYYPVVTVSNVVTGEVCQVVTGSPTAYAISWDQHHKKVHSLTYLPITAGSDCRRFSAKLYLAVDPALNPLRVEPSNYSVGYFVNYASS